MFGRVLGMSNGEQLHADPKAPVVSEGADFSKRVQTAVELLEAVMADRTLLSGFSDEERSRLMRAAGEVYCPDVTARKGLLKAKNRAHKQAKVKRDDEVLNQSGIRQLRSKPVFKSDALR